MPLPLSLLKYESKYTEEAKIVEKEVVAASPLTPKENNEERTDM